MPSSQSVIRILAAVAAVSAIGVASGGWGTPPCVYESWQSIKAVSLNMSASVSRMSPHTAQRNGTGVGCAGSSSGCEGFGPGIGTGPIGGPGQGGGGSVSVSPVPQGGTGMVGALPAVIDPFLGAFMPKFGADLARQDSGYQWFSGVTHNGRQETLVEDAAIHKDSNGPQGFNWMQDGHPELQRYTRDNEQYIVMVYDANHRLLFRRVSNVWPFDIRGENPEEVFQPHYLGIDGTYGVLFPVTLDPDLEENSGDEFEIFEYHDRTNRVYTFFGFEGDGFTMDGPDLDSDPDLDRARGKGQLWKVVDQDGDDASGSVSYVGDIADPVTAIDTGFAGTVADPLGIAVAWSDNYKYVYSYSPSPIGGIQRLLQVEVFDPTETTSFGKVEYDYHDGNDAHGYAGDLKTITKTTPLSESGEFLTETRYIRYYKGSYNALTNKGAAHLIKLIVDPEGYRRYVGTVASADDAELKAYSSIFLTYVEADVDGTSGDDLHVETVFMNGECGCAGGANGTYAFSYQSNGSYAGGSDESDTRKPWGDSATNYFDWDETHWFSRTDILQPDGTTQVMFFDRWGQVLGSVKQFMDGMTLKSWATKYIRDDRGRVVEVFSPEAVAYDDATGEMDVTTPTTGLITRVEYSSPEMLFESDDLPDAIVKWSHRDGYGGTNYLDRFVQYSSGHRKVIGNVSDYQAYLRRPMIASNRRYFETVATGSGDEAIAANYEETLYEYTVFSPTLPAQVWLHTWQLATATTHYSAVDEDKNGEEAVDDSITYFRPDGTVAFTRGRDGVFNYTALDANDRVVSSVRDADDDGLYGADDPTTVTDWGITLPGNGLHIKTEYTYDDLGRSLTTMLPNGRVMENHYTVLSDGRSVTIHVPYVKSADYRGPASVTVKNLAGRPEITASVALDNDDNFINRPIEEWIDTAEGDLISALANGLGGTHSLWRIGVMLYDEPGTKALKTRQYFDLTSVTTFTGNSGIGNTTDNFDETLYTYDSMGRPFRVTAPSGTITETLYDELGRNVGSRMGTDASATISDNMKRLTTLEYDGGGIGNGYLTSSTQHTTASSGDNRVTEFLNDYRGRIVVTKPPLPPYSLIKYDNLNRVVASGTYSDASGLTASADPVGEDTDRLSLSQSFFDERGQRWKTITHEIVQSSGAIKTGSPDPKLYNLTWFSPAGDVVQTRGRDIQKFAYDRLRRRTHVFTIGEADLTYEDVYNSSTMSTVLADDIVFTENQTYYDDLTGNPLFSASIERHYDDPYSGTTGPLDTNADGDRSLITAANIEGRPQITAMWYDDLDRPVTTAAYGTNGGSSFDFFPIPSPPNPEDATATVLVTKREYNPAGFVTKVTDPRELISTTAFDRAGRTVRTTANDDGSPGNDTVSTFYTFAKGLQTEMWVDMNADGDFDSGTDQKTKYVYGTSSAGAVSGGYSLVDTGHLLRMTIYPDSSTTPSSGTDAVFAAYNRLGEKIWSKDQAGNITELTRDDRGRETARVFSTIVSPFDNWVQSVGTVYGDPRGLVTKRTQYSNTGLSTAVNELAYTYNDAGLLSRIEQDNDSTVGAGTPNHFTTEFAFALTDASDTGDSRNAYRMTEVTYPDGSKVKYAYNDRGDIDDKLNRVDQVLLRNIDVTPAVDEVLAEYTGYNGVSSLMSTEIVEPKTFHSLANLNGTPQTYDHIDQFNRITRSRWARKAVSNYANYYNVALTYDNSSNITAVNDARFDQFVMAYSMDKMNRLTGAAGAGVGDTLQGESFTLDRAGNFSFMGFDANDNADFGDSGDLSDTRTHNAVNEILDRDLSDPADASPERRPVYDPVGNMSNDHTDESGVGYRYIYDVMGRMTRIETNDESTPTVVAQFKYDANHQRIAWKHPTLSSDDGLADEWLYAIYDHRWRMIEVRRDESSLEDGDPQARFERYYYHNAGIGGSGNSSYIDHVIARDRNAAFAEEGDETLEERLYSIQNWRGDVVAQVTPAGRFVERIRYSAYGRPFNIPAGDYAVGGSVNGTITADEWPAFSDLWFAQNTMVGADLSADHNSSGDVTSDDIFAMLDDWLPYLNEVTGRDVLSRGMVGNRKGYAGYEHDPFVPSLQLARNRFYRADLGTWMRRDPIKYADGANLLQYCAGMAIERIDSYGLASCSQTTPPTCDIGLQGSAGTDCHAKCTEVCDANPDADGVTICLGTKAVACVCYSNIRNRSLIPNKTWEQGLAQCTAAHEIEHRDLDIDCSMNPRPSDVPITPPNLPFKPSVIPECAEVRAWLGTLKCVEKIDCKGDQACEGYKESYLKDQPETVRKYLDKCINQMLPPI